MEAYLEGAGAVVGGAAVAARPPGAVGPGSSPCCGAWSRTPTPSAPRRWASGTRDACGGNTGGIIVL